MNIYNETTFDIDLISDAYNTKDPLLIQQHAKSDLNSNLEIIDITNHLNSEISSVRDYTLVMQDIF